MQSIVREKIIYTGLSEYIPEDIDSFTQMNINKILTIDESLKDIDEILKVSVSYNIKNSNIAKTAIGKSLEGQILTGYKLLTEGEFFIQINYSSDDANCGIYIHRDKIFFNNATALDKSINPNSNPISTVFIEDVYCDKISEKEVLININFIFTAENY